MTGRVEDFFTVRRHAERGSHERAAIDAILDEALYCTVGFVDAGRPVVIPTIHVRLGDQLVLHGSIASRMLRHLGSGAPCAVGVTLLDGLVLARSVFNHSMNYRSVVLFGSAAPVRDPDRKREALRAFTEKLLPGRWGDARPPSEKELLATALVALPIDTASAKVRRGPPGDDPEDLALPVWAGVIPFRLSPGIPEPAPDLGPGIAYPEYLRRRYPD